MATVLILGAGVMGSAFSLPLADAGHDVRLVGTPLDAATIDSLKQSGIHPRLNAPLPTGVRAFHHHELASALSDEVELVVIGVSTAGVHWAIDLLKPAMPGPRPIMMLTKGLDADGQNIRPLTDPVGEALKSPTGGVGGPCIAGELAVRRDTSVVFAHPEEATLRRLLDLVNVPYYHARGSRDVVGTEVCAALKNFYALGIGAATGMLDQHGQAENGALMHNIAAGLFAQALLELKQINALVGGSDASVHGLAGTGDLYVTVQGGRNSRMGRLLGAGWLYSKAKAEKMKDDTVEGAELALSAGPTLERMMDDGALAKQQMPLTSAIIDAIRRDHEFAVDWQRFHYGH
ncbi:MAG TPA: 2-dehydropantoate 2-reductase N-terminal domain-containing protein [Geminicoccus sp.]|jgi:glycerol-3-phosphate dehydrogenase (NAD(P)+)|uniref:2-dehydropantoate 2-reductase N-terminal domain-containing protein n=1 Tax=Geminicoccus sp. TaxID=2024832 RepID=UPI002E3735CD|nr:2-dehydropantoate 2-reductase N-terminal domain-containing protein [Geminicoccus sp.]HEX2527760.1 2-dehydropantoate 2-reductase N-terminal domain-containing protein [Geminicoccus sp.]